MRRGTANILVTLAGRLVIARFNRLAAMCDVLALQEWPRGRNLMLALRGQLIQWPRLQRRGFKPRGEWTFYRPRLGGSPIGVRNSRGETPISCKAKILVGPGFVGRIPGRKSVLGPSYATRLKTRLPDGTIKIRYNFHLTAQVQIGKDGYRKDKASARRVARHRNERDRLEWLVERDQAKYGEENVEAYGDSNFHHMPIPGLVGWWETERETGTLGPRAIDGIWTSEAPDEVDFLSSLVPHEHRHVITTSN